MSKTSTLPQTLRPATYDAFKAWLVDAQSVEPSDPWDFGYRAGIRAAIEYLKIAEGCGALVPVPDV